MPCPAYVRAGGASLHKAANSDSNQCCVLHQIHCLHLFSSASDRLGDCLQDGADSRLWRHPGSEQHQKRRKRRVQALLRVRTSGARAHWHALDQKRPSLRPAVSDGALFKTSVCRVHVPANSAAPRTWLSRGPQAVAVFIAASEVPVFNDDRHQL